MPELSEEQKKNLLSKAESIFKLGQKSNPNQAKLEEKVKKLTEEVKALKEKEKTSKSTSSSELVKIAMRAEEAIKSGTSAMELDDVRKITNAFTLEKNVTQSHVDKAIKALMTIREKVPKAEKAPAKVAA